MVYCSSCGASIDEDEKKCSNCGKKVRGIKWHPAQENQLTGAAFLAGTVLSTPILGNVILAMVYGGVLAIAVWIIAFLRWNLFVDHVTE